MAGKWGLQPNQDYDQRWTHYDRYDYAREVSGGDWEYHQAREQKGDGGKWRNWE